MILSDTRILEEMESGTIKIVPYFILASFVWRAFITVRDVEI